MSEEVGRRFASQIEAVNYALDNGSSVDEVAVSARLNGFDEQETVALFRARAIAAGSACACEGKSRPRAGRDCGATGGQAETGAGAATGRGSASARAGTGTNQSRWTYPIWEGENFFPSNTTCAGRPGARATGEATASRTCEVRHRASN
jgi:hypothetical protein